MKLDHTYDIQITQQFNAKKVLEYNIIINGKVVINWTNTKPVKIDFAYLYLSCPWEPAASEFSDIADFLVIPGIFDIRINTESNERFSMHFDLPFI